MGRAGAELRGQSIPHRALLFSLFKRFRKCVFRRNTLETREVMIRPEVGTNWEEPCIFRPHPVLRRRTLEALAVLGEIG